jgi:hypothetical protein
MTLSIDFNALELDKFAKQTDVAVKELRPTFSKAVRDTAVFATREVKIATPVKTGTTRRQWQMQKVNDLEIDVSNDSKIAVFLETGTKPHTIEPKRAKALFFSSIQGFMNNTGESGSKLKFRATGKLTAGSLKKWGNSAFTLVKKVKHPGTKALRIAEKVSSRASTYFNDIVLSGLNELKGKLSQ